MSNKDVECYCYAGCFAPICPLDANSVKNCPWFPDEEICKLGKYRKLRLVKRQKKIKQKGVAQHTCFTAQMLERNIKVNANLRGLAPNVEMSIELERWLKQYPVVNKNTVKEKKADSQQNVQFNRILTQGRENMSEVIQPDIVQDKTMFCCLLNFN